MSLLKSSKRTFWVPAEPAPKRCVFRTVLKELCLPKRNACGRILRHNKLVNFKGYVVFAEQKPLWQYPRPRGGWLEQSWSWRGGGGGQASRRWVLTVLGGRWGEGPAPKKATRTKIVKRQVPLVVNIPLMTCCRNPAVCGACHTGRRS